MKYNTDKNGYSCSFSIRANPEHRARIKALETDGYGLGTGFEHETMFVNSQTEEFDGEAIAKKLFNRVRKNTFYAQNKVICEVTISDWKNNRVVYEKVLQW